MSSPAAPAVPAAPPRGRARLRDPLVLGLPLAAFVAYAAYAVVNHVRYGTGYDLGIFSQAVWHYSRFEAPESTVIGISNLLGNHFHPIVASLTPLYWVWADPIVLLVAQAALVAASIVPVHLFAAQRLGRLGGLLVAVAYASYWGLHAGVGYEFHEVAFAPVLIALAILFGERRRWVPFAVAIAALLLVKEDMSILVAFFGLWLMLRREWRPGAITFAAGLAWFFLTTEVLIPALSDSGRFDFWSYQELGDDLPDALVQIATHPWRPFEVFFSEGQKVETTLLLLVPFLGLSLCSRIGILALPLVLERMLSTTESYWATDFHYSLTVAPVLAMAAAAGLANVVRWAGDRVPRGPAVTGVGAAMVVASLVAAVQIAHLDRLLERGFWRPRSYSGPVTRALDRIPPRASVAAPDFMVPHLSTRDVVAEISPGTAQTDYVAIGVDHPVGSVTGNQTFREQNEVVLQRLDRYVPVFYELGWMVLQREDLARGPGVLTPVPPLRGRALRRVADDGVRALVAHGGELVGCAAAGPRAPACFERAGADFRAAHARLVEVVGDARPELRGGCRHLGVLALRGAAALASEVERVRERGRAGDTAGAGRELREVQRSAEALDLSGRVRRLPALCATPERPT